MTRAQFIASYHAPGFDKDDAGLLIDGKRVMAAVPCDCGERHCRGWTMEFVKGGK